MTNIDAFKAKAAEAKTNRDWLSEYTAKGSSSYTALANDAYKTNKETADEVDRTTSDSSSSGSSTIQDIATIATLAMTAATTGLSIYQTITGKGAGGSGGTTGGATTSTPQDTAGTINGLVAGGSVSTKKGRAKLEKAMAEARIEIEANNKSIEAKNTELNNKELAKGNAANLLTQYSDNITKAQGTLATSLTEYNNAVKSEDENNKVFTDLEKQRSGFVQSLNSNNTKLNAAREDKSKLDQNAKLIDYSMAEIDATITDANQQKDAHKLAYSDALDAQSGLEQNYKDAKDKRETSENAISNYGKEIKNYEKEINDWTNKKNKSKDTDTSSYDKKISEINNKKLAAEELKNNEEAGLQAKKDKEAKALEAKEHNEQLIEDLKKALGEDATKIEQAKQDLAAAKVQKEDAYNNIVQCTDQIDQYLDLDKVLQGNVKDNYDQTNDVKTASEANVIAIAQSLTNVQNGKETIDLAKAEYIDVAACDKIAEADIRRLNGEIDDLNKKNASLQKAIENGEKALTGSTSSSSSLDMADLDNDNDIAQNLKKAGYTGKSDDVSTVTPNTDGSYTIKTKDGKTETWKDGKKVEKPATETPTTGTSAPAGGAGGTEKPDDKPTFTALTQKDGKPEKPAGFTGDVPDGATSYAKDNDGNFIFSVNGKAEKYNSKGEKIADEK